jgi:hypothetical protein
MTHENPNAPQVPPRNPHRSVGDTGTPQHGRTNSDGDDVEKDDPREANEEGDQRETHRNRGRVTDDKGAPLGEANVKDHEPSKDEHWESGRHKSD